MGSVAGDQPVEPAQDTPGVIQLAPAATVFHDTLERNYPHYPKIEDISLTNTEMVTCSKTYFYFNFTTSLLYGYLRISICLCFIVFPTIRVCKYGA